MSQTMIIEAIIIAALFGLSAGIVVTALIYNHVFSVLAKRYKQ